jgi:hypothetical protein
MLLVVVDEHDIPGWLYPAAFPEVPRPPEDRAEVPDLDFARPNEQEKARHKELLKELCRIAKRSVETRRPLVVL